MCKSKAKATEKVVLWRMFYLILYEKQSGVFLLPVLIASCLLACMYAKLLFFTLKGNNFGLYASDFDIECVSS